MFGDYHHESGTGLVITQRIFFGTGNIEPHHEKCLDFELPDALAHYRVVLTANARLAGTHKSGRLGNDLDEIFPFDPKAESATDFIRYDTRQLHNRIARIAAFAEEFPRLLPANITASPDQAFSEQRPRSHRFVSLERQYRQCLVLAR
jgi:hypothetical protein